MTASSDHDRTLNQLERQAERTRADLLDTVEELRERVSPSQVKADVKQYAKSTGQDLVSNIVEKARENPLQAAAIAAAIAYPAWHLIRTIPVPVLLLGAGAVMAGQVGNGTSGQGLSGRFGFDAERSRGARGAGAWDNGEWDYGQWDDASAGGGIRSFMDRNPMLVTGLGLFVGALIGGSLTASGALHRPRSGEHYPGGMSQ
ncbi:MAG TPA: DUF3618 domain-containing protein [Alphaproteobacteria bacterium]